MHLEERWREEERRAYRLYCLRTVGVVLSLPLAFLVAWVVWASGPQALAQESDLKGNYNQKSGLITPAVESGIEVQVVTTDSVPGKQCRALADSEGRFPVMVLPTSGSLGGRTLADGAIRGMKTLREAARAGGRGECRPWPAQQSLHHPQRQPADVPVRNPRAL